MEVKGLYLKMMYQRLVGKSATAYFNLHANGEFKNMVVTWIRPFSYKTGKRNEPVHEKIPNEHALAVLRLFDRDKLPDVYRNGKKIAERYKLKT